MSYKGKEHLVVKMHPTVSSIVSLFEGSTLINAYYFSHRFHRLNHRRPYRISSLQSRDSSFDKYSYHHCHSTKSASTSRGSATCRSRSIIFAPPKAFPHHVLPQVRSCPCIPQPYHQTLIDASILRYTHFPGCDIHRPMHAHICDKNLLESESRVIFCEDYRVIRIDAPIPCPHCEKEAEEAADATTPSSPKNSRNAYPTPPKTSTPSSTR